MKIAQWLIIEEAVKSSKCTYIKNNKVSKTKRTKYVNKISVRVCNEISMTDLVNRYNR